MTTNEDLATAVLNEEVIKQWRADLLDRGFGLRFNADYSCIRDDDGKIAGDAAMFLVYRHGDLINDEDIFKWYEKFSFKAPYDGGYHDSELIVTQYTGIPLEDAAKLMWPTVLINDEFDLSKITPKEFVTVLDLYLETGIVDWKVIL